jgi:CBS domain-containing protein
MKVKTFMVEVPKIIFVSDKITIAEAGATLLEKGVGSLLILNSNETKRVICGIVTKSDIISGYLSFKGEESITKVMQKKFVYCDESDSVSKLAELMAKKGIHHILVLNDKKHLVGITSSMDIAKEIYQDSTDSFPYYRTLFGIPKKTTDNVSKGVSDVIEDIMNAIVFPEPLSLEGYSPLQ